MGYRLNNMLIPGSLAVPVFVIAMRILGTTKYKKYSKQQMENHEKYIKGGKSASKPEIAVSNYSILVGSVIFILLGPGLLITKLLKY